jgi:hypothetical protein
MIGAAALIGIFQPGHSAEAQPQPAPRSSCLEPARRVKAMTEHFLLAYGADIRTRTNPHGKTSTFTETAF